MKNLLMFACFLICMIGSTACGDPSVTADAMRGSESVGEGRFALKLPSGEAVDVLSWVISRQRFTKSGTVPIDKSTSASFVVGGLPQATGYTIDLTATGVYGTTCSGTAEFAVTAGEITPVDVVVRCSQARRRGGVQVNGELSVCPEIDELNVTPSEVTVGSHLTLSAVAVDTDTPSESLTFTWSAPYGEFSSNEGATTSYTCSEPGVVPVQLTVTDGDCESVSTVSVTCSNECPASDSDPCTVDTCNPDGSTSHEPSGWEGCGAALEAIDICPEASFGEAAILDVQVCNDDLAAALAEAGDETPLEAAWPIYADCVSTAVGCGSVEQDAGAPRSASRVRSAFGGSTVCQVTEYGKCMQDELSDFKKGMLGCTAASLAMAPFTTPVLAAQAFGVCAVTVAAVYTYGTQACRSQYTCASDQSCINEQCVDVGMTITSATYGGNCGQPQGNVTGIVANQCNGLDTCAVWVHNEVFNDPVFGCAKDFSASFACPDGSVGLGYGAAAVGEGYTVLLGCS